MSSIYEKTPEKQSFVSGDSRWMCLNATSILAMELIASESLKSLDPACKMHASGFLRAEIAARLVISNVFAPEYGLTLT